MPRKPGSPVSRLHRVMEAFGLRAIDVVRTTELLAAELGRAPVSRAHFGRLRHRRGTTTESRIFIMVAAFRELTGYSFSANDLFELEPPLADRPIDSGNTPVPIFSGPRRTAAWRPFVDDDAGSGEPPFESLYTEYGVLLRAIAMREFRVPPDDAEAVVHDAFIAYLQRQTTVREAKGWLIGTVRNGCRHYWRDRKRDSPLDELAEEPMDVAAEGRREASFWRITVAGAVARLGVRCREMLRSYYWKDESTADIAGRLSMSKDNVWQLLSRCRQRVGEALGKVTSKVTRPRK